MAMDFGFTNTDIYFFTDSQTELMRQIPLGLRDLYNELATANDTPYSVKKTIDLSEGANSMFREAEPFLEQWVDEIVKVVQYYRSLRKGKIIKRLFLFGGGSMIKGLTEYLTKVFDIPSEVLYSINKVQNAQVLGDHGLALCLNAIGAIIRL